MKHCSAPWFMTAGLLAIAAVMAWAAFKPVRILAPSLNGVTCVGRACVENLSPLSKATALQRRAVAAVGRKLVPLEEVPLTVFCSSRRCYESFGGGRERGATLFNWGVIVPPESWVPYIVEHEYIHMLQAQQLGLVGRQQTPAWFKERMPFVVSNPPDDDVPDYARPLVAQYTAWERTVAPQQCLEGGYWLLGTRVRFHSGRAAWPLGSILALGRH